MPGRHPSGRRRAPYHGPAGITVCDEIEIVVDSSSLEDVEASPGAGAVAKADAGVEATSQVKRRDGGDAQTGQGDARPAIHPEQATMVALRGDRGAGA